MEFEAKTALITGGATGIGKALARLLSAEGMNVVIASTNSERLNVAADELNAEGARVTPMVCDVSDREAVRALAARVEKEFGGTYLLCANAGGSTTGPLLAHGDGEWDWGIDVVFRGVTNCVQAFYPAMAKRGSGKILITGSHMGCAPDMMINHGPYAAAKGGVHALAASLRPEAAKNGVGVSLLVPAMTETDMVASPQRARQSRYGPAVERGGIEMREGAAAPLPNFPRAMSPEQVAERALAGLKADVGIIATHAALVPSVREYAERVVAAYEDAAKYP